MTYNMINRLSLSRFPYKYRITNFKLFIITYYQTGIVWINFSAPVSPFLSNTETDIPISLFT